jgi:hypothetical protein
MDPVEFEFQELTPRDSTGRCIDGIMLSGTAVLEGSDPNWPDQFYVTHVHLDGGYTLDKARPFDKALFKLITDEINNDKTELGRRAQSEFTEAVEAGKPEIPFRQRMAREMERRA